MLPLLPLNLRTDALVKILSDFLEKLTTDINLKILGDFLELSCLTA